MKYLVLKRVARSVDPFVELVSARGKGQEIELAYKMEQVDFENDQEVGDTRRDPLVDDVLLSIPFTLIEPPQEAADGPLPDDIWGLEAVGAMTSPFDGSGVTVAVLDTGIDTRHDAFKGIDFSARNLMDFTSKAKGEPGSATDDRGHGTHVAGILFGREVGGRRIGVAPGVERVLIGKVIGESGTDTEAVYNAIEWALRERADVVSMSLGFDFPKAILDLIADGLPADIAGSRALDAYRRNLRLFDRLAALVGARADGGRSALLIAASGNESRRKENPRYTVTAAPPSTADGFIAVGAVGRTGNAAAPYEVASFSNTGCLLSGPGVSIVSAQAGGTLVAKNGTSVATPHVAGVAALWTQKLLNGSTRRPRDWTSDVQRELETHVVRPAGLSRRDVGLGIVQAPQP